MTSQTINVAFANPGITIYLPGIGTFYFPGSIAEQICGVLNQAVNLELPKLIRDLSPESQKELAKLIAQEFNKWDYCRFCTHNCVTRN